jgi:hypothetical protein
VRSKLVEIDVIVNRKRSILLLVEHETLNAERRILKCFTPHAASFTLHAMQFKAEKLKTESFVLKAARYTQCSLRRKLKTESSVLQACTLHAMQFKAES